MDWRAYTLVIVSMHHLPHGRGETLLGPLEGHPVLGPRRAREHGHDIPKVEVDGLVETQLPLRIVPEALRPGVGLDELDVLVRTAGEPQIAERLLVNREQGTCGPELGAHVGDRRPIGEGQAGDAGTGELDELADDSVCT